MRLSRGNILRALLYSPLAALGLWNKAPAVGQGRPRIIVLVCCAYCSHYIPPQPLFMLGNSP
jgi:hypothetical protein